MEKKGDNWATWWCRFFFLDSLLLREKRLFSTVDCKQQRYNDLAAWLGYVRACLNRLIAPHLQCPRLFCVTLPKFENSLVSTWLEPWKGVLLEHIDYLLITHRVCNLTNIRKWWKMSLKTPFENFEINSNKKVRKSKRSKLELEKKHTW